MDQVVSASLYLIGLGGVVSDATPIGHRSALPRKPSRTWDKIGMTERGMQQRHPEHRRTYGECSIIKRVPVSHAGNAERALKAELKARGLLFRGKVDKRAGASDQELVPRAERGTVMEIMDI